MLSGGGQACLERRSVTLQEDNSRTTLTAMPNMILEDHNNA